MGNGDNARCVFPLTSLQIGDLQSYLSRLSLFLAPESKKFYILVDNQPWLEDLVSRPAHLWQLMVTKSRLSPFANTRGQNVKKEPGEFLELRANSKTNPSKPKKFKRWFSLIDAATLSHKRALLPVKKLRNSLILNGKLNRTLYGFIVFEVAWADVRGMNYLNELQSDTSLAIEAKFMKRWEFDSIVQAAKCISSWFPGTCGEQLSLKEYLDSATGEVFYDARDNFSTISDVDDNENIFTDSMCPEEESPCYYSSNFSVYPATTENMEGIPRTPSPPDCPNKRRKVTTFVSSRVEVDMYSEEIYNDGIGSPSCSRAFYASDQEEAVEATQYRDVLLLFRFNDPELPFKLKDIIISNLRLLTLLESGLPSWVIFVQSYPGFCHLYRPWMCPLARALYVLISFITVLIGFYDLYKNVPLLKATASRLCGPLFDWIETWEMITRIKYLGTMLFLHNFRKAVKWFLMTTRTIRSFLSIVTQPMAGPFAEFLELLLPFWNMCTQVAESLFSVIWIIIGSCCSLVENLIDILLLPRYILSVIWSIVMSIVYPVFWMLWEILYTPVRLILGLFRMVTFTCSCIYDLVGDVWFFVSGIFQFTSDTGSTGRTYEVSMWRSLWNDLFSQVFRAVRSILNGFVAFFVACNRHRLSIYNHVKECIQRLCRPAKRGPRLANLSRKGQTSGTKKLSEHWEGNRHFTISRKQR